MIALAAEHSEKVVSDPMYKYLGGEGYKEREAAVAGFHSVIDHIYQQVGPVKVYVVCP